MSQARVVQDRKVLESLVKKVKKIPLIVSTTKKTLQINNLPAALTKKQLYKKVKKFGEIVDLTYTDSQSHAQVAYSSTEEAERGLKGLHKHTFKGSQLEVTVLVSTSRRAGRLIIRNLAFNTSGEHMKSVFDVYGTHSVDLPLRDGKMRGFGFVQFTNILDAKRAMDGVNGTCILGRPVAVDWAVAKDIFDKEPLADVEEDTDKNEILGATSNLEQPFPQATLETVQEAAIIADQETSDADIMQDNNDIVMESEPIIVEADNLNSIEQVSDFEELDHDVTEEDHESIFQVSVDQGCTIFIRNIPYETNQSMLEEIFSKFGSLRYARITMDRETNMSRGTAFVCYMDSQDAVKLMEKYDKIKAMLSIATGGLEFHTAIEPELPNFAASDIQDFKIGGRFLNMNLAVSKEDSSKLTQHGVKSRQRQDKRNMYLIDEGRIPPDSEAAKLIAETDLAKRNESFIQRRKLLAGNPNLFISKTRLSIRQLPFTVTEPQLKMAGRDSVIGFWKQVDARTRPTLESIVMEEDDVTPSSSRKIWVKQAKIVREKEKLDADGKPKSKGYGFVEFTCHTDALACLRFMNNNSTIFCTPGFERTPIVEFALENRSVLIRRDMKTNHMSASKRPRSGEVAEAIEEKKSKYGDSKDFDRKARKEYSKLKSTTKKNGKTANQEYKENMMAQKSYKKEIRSDKKLSNLKPGETPIPESRLHGSKKTGLTRKERDEKRKPKIKSGPDDIKFESLVANYKQKLDKPIPGKATDVLARSKWF